MNDHPNPEIVKQVENAVCRLIDLTDNDKITWASQRTNGLVYWHDNTRTVCLCEEIVPRRLRLYLYGGYDMPVCLRLKRKLLSAIKRSQRRAVLPQTEGKCLEFILRVASIEAHDSP